MTTTLEREVARFRKMTPPQEIDEEGKLSATSAFELARQGGINPEILFSLGFSLVQNISWKISCGKSSEEGLREYRALILAVLALGEHQLATGNDSLTNAVQYLRDVLSRHREDMDEEQAEAILHAVFGGNAA
jgi:hypothetical protein